MEKKYIECEAAYRFAQDQLKKETGAYSKGWNHAMNVMKGALHNNDALPAADVVPIVRCKDCVCFHPIGTSEYNGDCDKHYERVQCDDYCSWAEPQKEDA